MDPSSALEALEPQNGVMSHTCYYGPVSSLGAFSSFGDSILAFSDCMLLFLSFFLFKTIVFYIKFKTVKLIIMQRCVCRGVESINV